MPAISLTSPLQTDATVPASWLRGATIYGVVVRNIGNGDFQSVTERLDDLVDLGISALWFAPITQTPPGCYGYEVTNYVNVRPEYGTLADFRRLVDVAHVRNLRVILDFVPNHTSSEHPYYQSVLQDGESSPWYDFYDRDEQGEITHYFDWTHLPNLNFDNDDVRCFVTEAFMFWVREMDVDGFRVDVAWGIRQRRPDFWPEFSAAFKRAKPDGVLIAEASARDPYYVANGFDVAYDWSDKLGVWAWNEVFTDQDSIPKAILRALTDNAKDTPNSAVLRFLNNNDSGARFITTYGADMYRVASAMLLTLPGVPCLFTGDEVGAEFEPYRLNGAIDWTDRYDLRPRFRKLIRLRRDIPAVAETWHPIDVEPANSILGYTMGERESPVLVLLNFSDRPVTATIDSGDFESIFADKDALRYIYNETSVETTRSTGRDVSIPAWGIRLLTAELAAS